MRPSAPSAIIIVILCGAHLPAIIYLAAKSALRGRLKRAEKMKAERMFWKLAERKMTEKRFPKEDSRKFLK
jgi:hypothetical protein